MTMTSNWNSNTASRFFQRPTHHPRPYATLVLDYREAFNLLHEYLGKARVDAPEEDIQEFFRWMLESYFLKKSDQEPRFELYNLFLQNNPMAGDYAEVKGDLVESVNDVFEAIDQHTRLYLPNYGLNACGKGISDCTHRHSTTYEIQLEPVLVQPLWLGQSGDPPHRLGTTVRADRAADAPGLLSPYQRVPISLERTW